LLFGCIKSCAMAIGPSQKRHTSVNHRLVTPLFDLALCNAELWQRLFEKHPSEPS